MLNLDFFKTAIELAVPSVRVLYPTRKSTTNVDTSLVLSSLLGSIVNNRVYAYRLPDLAVYPSIVYEQIGFHRTEIDGYILAKSDEFMISAQAENLNDILSVQLAMLDALNAYHTTGNAGSIEIIDHGVTYNDVLKRFEAAIHIEVTHLTLDSQTLPVYYLYPLQLEADESQVMSCVSQPVHQQFCGVLVADMPSNGLSGLSTLRESLISQILGKQQPATRNTRAELVKGNSAGLIGSIALWRDVFTVTQLTHYT